MPVAPGRLAPRLHEAATRPVSSASVAFLRMAFGVGMVVNTLLYLPVLVRDYYVDTSFHFSYGPLTFVQPLPGAGMYLVYVAMGITGVLIALGRWYRWAAAAFFVLTTYVFLIDSTFFQNHEYLISLLALLLAVLPGIDGRWSLDVERHPERRRSTVPAWVVWLLRFQVGVPYFFGGIAKLNGDWLRGEPLRAWLASRTDIGWLNGLLTNDGVVWFMAHGSLVLDLVVVWLLLHRRTRVPAYVVVTGFHLLNVWLFGLFIFPWLMIAATTIFFDPSWPERALARWRSPAAEAPPRPEPAAGGRVRRLSPLLVGALGLWVALQVLLPLRHLTVAGSPSWTEEHHRFSWHMKLRDKRGDVTYVVTAADGRTWRVDPAEQLSPKQAYRLSGHPERLVHFARHLSAQHGGAEVRAETSVSLNGRRPQPIVDPTVDLASQPVLWWGPADWILPLEEPLRRSD
ncbi:MAG TPA: HTTM domain-containing protein [Acidimicrobiales bacterium]|nr:HTTM domain-containing protein [Acidimicrobiales bacterium]